ncbi:tRNA lysidine(34) synthetase TilS [Rhizobium sp. CFBP 8762]|nr:tRNA lysidine(34) synthetase TilS [Rhizobium sp. CFBP 8762]
MSAVRSAIDRFLNSFDKPARLLVAVSGGSDSKGLLLALAQALPAFPTISLVACTVDHGLRPEAADEALEVEQFCARIHVPHIIQRWNGKKPRAGIQAAARAARYGLLADAADRFDATAIVTGHSRDDQLETIAMRQTRSAPDAIGLAGMAGAVLYDTHLWILRPLLTVSREDIRQFLRGQGEGWIDDPSNDDLHYERVRIRQRPQADSVALPRRLESSYDATRYLDRTVRIHLGLVAEVSHELCQHLRDANAVRALAVLTAVMGGRTFPFGSETKERLLQFLQDGKPGRLTAGRVVFDLRRDAVYLYREARGLNAVAIADDDQMQWDNRLLVTNHTGGPIQVAPGGDNWTERLVSSGVALAVAKRASPAGWRIMGQPGNDIALTSGVTTRRAIALYDTFLPCFDLPLANQLAKMLNRAAYPLTPVHNVCAN